MIRVLSGLSNGVGLAEGWLCRLLVAALPVMILVNVFTRALGRPIYWMDELAVYTMVWFAMVGLSLTLHNRDAVAVTLLRDAVPPTLRWIFAILIDLLVLAFTLALLVLSWMWFDPVGLWRAEFDFPEYAASSFNYIYQEPTATLGLRKVWFWLVIPLIATTAGIHALANLACTLRRRPDWLDAAREESDRAPAMERES